MKYVAIILMTVLMTSVSSGCELENTLAELKDAINGIEDIISQEDEEESSSKKNHFAGTINGGEQDSKDEAIIIGGSDGIISVISPDKDEDAENEDAAPEGNVTVEEALNYEKSITGYSFNENGQLVIDTENAGAYGQHKIRIPKIVDEGADVNAINDKLYSAGESKYNTLINDKEGLETYHVDYFSSVNGKAVAIIQEINIGEQMVGGYAYYKTLYYDCQKHTEISFEDYISLMGFTRDTLNEKLKSIEDKYNYLSDENLENIKGVVLDSNSTYVLVDFPNAVDAEPASALFMFNVGIIE